MSQILDFWKGLSGTVLPFAGASAPSGWMLCAGQLLSRTTYAELFAVIGVTFGAGDGSTTFKLPDLRGEFIRCLDNGRGVDTGRTLGSSHAQAVQAHDHQISPNAYYPTNQQFPSGNFAGVFQLPGSEFRTGQTGGAETRPRNIALNYIIKI